MKPPGVRAKKHGTRLKRGAAVQVVCYPRPRTKSVLVEASRKAKKSLSSFLLRAALREAAAIEGRQVTDLIPPSEYQQYV